MMGDILLTLAVFSVGFVAGYLIAYVEGLFRKRHGRDFHSDG